MSTLAGLIAALQAAMVAYDADIQTYDKENDVNGRLVDDAREALFKHRPVSLDEARIKAEYMASCRAFTTWDDFDQIKLIRALTPAVPAPSPLVEAFRQWEEAERTFLTLDDDAQQAFCDDVLAPLDELIRTTPATTAQELAMKMRVFQESREHPLNAETDALIRGEAWQP